MKTTIKFVKEVEINKTSFVKIRFEDSFPGFKQDEDDNFVEVEVNEVIMYKSKFLAMLFNEIPLLALAYTRTESFLCIQAACTNASCELKRVLVRDEDSDHDRYDSLICNMKIAKAIQDLLDQELARAFA